MAAKAIIAAPAAAMSRNFFLAGDMVYTYAAVVAVRLLVGLQVLLKVAKTLQRRTTTFYPQRAAAFHSWKSLTS
jgi:hypothetical protein